MVPKMSSAGKRGCVFFTVIAALFVLSCNGKSGASQDTPEQENQTVSVQSELIQESSITKYLLANGNVEAKNTVDVFPSVQGKVIRAYKELGSAVQQGEAIASVDPSTPGNFFLPSTVVSPISGNIISVPLKTGTQVTAASVIATVGDLSGLKIRTQIPERYYALLKNGLKADFYAEAYPGEIFHAEVSEVSPVIDSVSRTSEVILSVSKSSARITAGMFVKIKLYLYSKEAVLTVPESAVIARGEEKIVYVLQENTARVRTVSTRIASDGRVEITSGIAGGERVITDGIDSLVEGSAVLDISEGAE